MTLNASVDDDLEAGRPSAAPRGPGGLAGHGAWLPAAAVEAWPDLSPAARALLVALAAALAGRARVMLSTAQLSTASGIMRAGTIGRAVRELETRGLIVRRRLCRLPSSYAWGAAVESERA